MFFDPDDYLGSNPDQAESGREAARLQREAEQRAKRGDNPAGGQGRA